MSNQDIDYYTYGYVIGGVILTIIALITLTASSIPIIWIGGFIVGPMLVIYGLINFSKKGQNNKTVNSIKQAISYHENNQPHQALKLIKSIEARELTEQGRDLLRSIRARCYAQLAEWDQALITISGLINSFSYTPQIEDFIFKIECEKKLDKTEDAVQTIETIKSKFTNNPELSEYLMSIL